MKTISDKVDNIKGLLMILVVAGHAIEIAPIAGGWRGASVANVLYASIYTFHMPALVFISGYLSGRAKKLGDLAWAGVGLYVLAQALWVAFLSALSLCGGGLPSLAVLSGLVPGWGLWYLLCLFVWRASAPVLTEIRHAPLVMGGLFSYGVLIGGSEANELLSISRLIVLLPYFALGYWCKTRNWGFAETRLRWYDAFLGAALLGVGPLVVAGCCSRRIDLLHFSRPFAELGVKLEIGALVRVGSALIALGMIRLLLLITPDRKTVFSRFGTQSLSLYLGHFYIIGLLRIFIPARIWLDNLLWITPCVIVLCASLIFLKLDHGLGRLRNWVSALIFRPPSVALSAGREPKEV
ncbi:MAG: acyltransferase family protein [Verrucomicrobia bacterium]|nr:acyltransferase family protein [Verrucomicrobiota bacterium]